MVHIGLPGMPNNGVIPSATKSMVGGMRHPEPPPIQGRRVEGFDDASIVQSLSSGALPSYRMP